MFRKLLLGLVAPAALAAMAVVPALADGNGAGGVSGPAIYVNGTLYRTVGTPTDFTNTGAPEHSYDTIYDFGGVQASVATAAPGDPGFNGGRWRVIIITSTDYESAAMTYGGDNGVFDNAEEVQAAIDAGALMTADGPWFECPVIPLAQGPMA